jgi:hypothetical protein
MNTLNSINQNGCSVCPKGQENYIRCIVGAFYGTEYYQYDYRHTDGELFSTFKKTLEECRELRDKWLQKKNFARLFSNTLKKIQDNQLLTKSEMAYQIGHIEPQNVVAISWDFFTREEIVSTFNQMFVTEVK